MLLVALDSVAEAVSAGQEALSRGAWEEARGAFEAALAQGEEPEALEGLGLAAWWLDDAEVTFDARERAYRLYAERGDRRSAARVATAIAWDYEAFRGELAVANGWLRRARRLLEGSSRRPSTAGWRCARARSRCIATPARRGGWRRRSDARSGRSISR